MREVLPGILSWSWLSPRYGYDLNGTLVLHDSGNPCIECGRRTRTGKARR